MFRKLNPVRLTNPNARRRVSCSRNTTRKLVLALSLAILAATSLLSGSERVQSARGFAGRLAPAIPQGVPTCAIPPSNMVSWWPLDETSGSIVLDIKGGHHGHLSANIGSDPYSASPPKVGNALSFVLHSMATVVGTPYNFGTGNFSIDAWVKGPQSNAALGIVDKLDASGTTGFAFFIRNGKLQLRMGTATFTSTPSITYNTWQHVAVTVQRVSGSPIGQFYLNGGLAGTFVPSLASVNNTTNLVLGNYHLNTGACTSCEVQLDEIEIFSDVVSPTDIKNIFKADKNGKCKATVSGAKFNDLNGNGVRNTGEPGLANWTIKITDSSGNTQTTTTDSAGNYSFTVPAPGTYTISEVVQTGWTQTAPTPVVPGTFSVTVSGGQVVTNRDFGNWKQQKLCDLQITKEMKPAPLLSGQTATAYVMVKNVGTGQCQGPTVVTDTPPAGLTPVSASVTGGTCVVGSGVCTYPPAIPVGASVVFVYIYNVSAQPGTVVANCASLETSGDLNPANNKACIKLDVIGSKLPDLTIQKSVSCSGHPLQPVCTVRFNIINLGPGSFSGFLNVQDLMSPVPSPPISPVSGSTTTGWTCTITGANAFVCASTGPVSLAPGQSVSVGTKVRIPGGHFENCAIVRGYAQAPFVASNLIPEVNSGNNQACVPMP
jgi:uncharacterized repeat protein (TIGR01451 family)